MEIANLTYRGNEDRNAMSDSEASPRRKLLQGRNLPVYLLESGRLPGIPKGRKVRKKKIKTPVNNTAKSYDYIDTHRTDFSKISSEFPQIIDSTRTDDSGLDFSILTPHFASSRQTPYVYSADNSMDLTEMQIQTPHNSIKIAHGLQKNLPPRRQTQSELGMTYGRSMRGDLTPKTTRTSQGKSSLDPKLPDSAPPSGKAASRLKQHPEGRPSHTSLGKRPVLDAMDYEPNPDVVPFQPANFMSSTILKKVPIPKRHLDTFGGYEYNFIGRRGVMLHTDRYQVDFIKSLDGMTQRERLQAGLDYMEAIRGTRRRREMVPHRAKIDLIMGGKQIEFEERFDIAREIQKLKAVAMPKNAKDLFHGRGIHLPSNHMSLHPRLPLPNDVEEIINSAPSALQHFPRRGGNDSHHELPKLDREATGVLFGKGTPLRSSSTFKKHPQLPSIRGKGDSGLHRDVTSLSRSHTQAPPPSRDPAWNSEPQKLIAKGTAEHMSPKKQQAPPVEIHLPSGDEDTGDRPHSPSAQGHITIPGSQGSQRQAESFVTDTASSHAPGHAPSTILPVPTSRESRVRPSTEEGAKSGTPHPLRGTDLITSVPQDEQEQLRQTFQRLDTDADGHLKYNQLKTQLPKKFTREQEKFTEEVYNLTNSITFFGIDEFMVMNRLSKTVESLTGRAVESYALLDFSTLPDELLKYVGKFDDVDTGNTGRISLDGLQMILSDTVSPSLTTDSMLWDEILDSINVDFSSQVSKVVFIAHIPLFLSLEKDHM